MRIFRPLDIVFIVAIIAVVITIVVVNLPEAKKPCECCVGALSQLRVICAAHVFYHSKYNTHATLEQLATANLIDPDFMKVVNSASPKSGYYFTYNMGKTTEWSCIARPATWGGCTCYTRNYLIGSDDSDVYYNEEENSSEFTKSFRRPPTPGW